MFSQGQLIFAALFFYRICNRNDICLSKRSQLHKIFYKGNYKILIGFFIFIAILFVIKFFLNIIKDNIQKYLFIYLKHQINISVSFTIKLAKKRFI